MMAFHHETEADVSSCFGHNQNSTTSEYITMYTAHIGQTSYITMFCLSNSVPSQVTTVIRLLRDGVAFVADYGLDITDDNRLNFVNSALLTILSLLVHPPLTTKPAIMLHHRPRLPHGILSLTQLDITRLSHFLGNEETNSNPRPRYRLRCFSSSLHAPQATQIPRIIFWRG